MGILGRWLYGHIRRVYRCKLLWRQRLLVLLQGEATTWELLLLVVVLLLRLRRGQTCITCSSSPYSSRVRLICCWMLYKWTKD